MNRSRDAFLRSVLLGLSLVALLAGLGWVVQERFMAPPPAPPPPAQVAPAPAAPAEPEAVVAIVLDVDGSVERGQGEAWRPLRVGDRLQRDESIRAHTGAQAELRVGEDSHVTLFEDSEMVLEEVTAALHILRLEDGRMKLDYPFREDRVLRMKTVGGAVAETNGARFMVLRSGIAVAVATEMGSVNLQAAGASVRVGAGEQSLAWDGKQPSAATPIPREVLLRVARRMEAGVPCAVVEGTVRPGTAVRVEGQRAEVARNGHFLVRVSSRPEREGVRVEASEPGGLRKEQHLACRAAPVRPRPASAAEAGTVEVDWDHAP